MLLCVVNQITNAHLFDEQTMQNDEHERMRIFRVQVPVAVVTSEKRHCIASGQGHVTFHGISTSCERTEHCARAFNVIPSITSVKPSI